MGPFALSAGILFILGWWCLRALPRYSRVGFGFEDARRWLSALRNLALRFADLEADEAADGNVVAELLAHRGDVISHGDFRVLFDEALVEQAIALIEFLELAFNDLGDGLWRLVFDLRGSDFAFFR